MSEIAYLPKELNGNLVLVAESEEIWRAVNDSLKAETHGLAYRGRKDLATFVKGDRFLEWGAITKGVDEGDGWLRVELSPWQASEADAPKQLQQNKVKIIVPETFLKGREPPQVDSNGEPSPIRSFLISQEPDIEVSPYFISSFEMMHLLDLAEGFWPLPRQAIEMVPLRFRQTVVVERIEIRMAAVAGLPLDHLERISVVRYSPCSPSQQRLLHGLGSSKTVFAWLGDLPPESGAYSVFPALGIGCAPRSGTALIWPDTRIKTSQVESEDPEEPPPMITQLGLDVVPPNEASGISMYGLLGIFKSSTMRSIIEPRSCVSLENAATVAMPGVEDSQEGRIHKFALESIPPVILVPKCCLASEVEHLLNLSPTFRAAREEAHPVILGFLAPGSDNVVSAVETRLVAAVGLPFESLGHLRVVSSGRVEGYCNRGCGPTTVYVCLSETDIVFFPYLGLKISMRRGDAILVPNLSEYSEGNWAEDVRTSRIHLNSSVGLEAIFCDWAVRPPQIQRPPPLELGSELKLSKFSFKIKEAIGMGSFGMVWGAQWLEAGEFDGSVVIKETICKSAENVAPTREAYEYKLLELLSAVSATDSSASCALSRVPLFVDSLAELVAPSLWRMRFAMGRVPGLTMDHFIMQCLEKRCKAKEAGEDVTSKKAQQQHFAEACHFARELVSQLAPTLAQISKLAIHRDVNSHNVMVDGDLANPRFYLVDFGLAVDNEAWFGPISQNSFHLYDIGGDCKYWPVAGWLMFLGGYEELRKYPVLEFEYSRLLDFHALGVIAMQGLMSLSPTPRLPLASNTDNMDQKASETVHSGKQSPGISEHRIGSIVSSVEEDGLCDEVRQLLHVWNRYWHDAHRRWQILFNAFRTSQDFGPVKMWCAQNAVHNNVAHQMCWVRQALILSLKSSSLPDVADARPLFLALLELICAGLCDDPPENGRLADNKRPRSWEAVCVAIGDVSLATAKTITPDVAVQTRAKPSEHTSPRLENGMKQEVLVENLLKPSECASSDCRSAQAEATSPNDLRKPIKLPISTASSVVRQPVTAKNGNSPIILPAKAVGTSSRLVTIASSPKSANTAFTLQALSPRSASSCGSSPRTASKSATSLGSPTHRLGIQLSGRNSPADATRTNTLFSKVL